MKKYVNWLLMALLVGLLAGCGSSRDSASTAGTDGGNLGVDAAGVAFVGATTCIDCHETMSFSEEAVADYLASKHVINFATIYGYDYMLANGCVDCHDPIGDSPSMSALLGTAVVTMGCENCHGAGGEHFGVGPIPSRNPDFNTCGQCHDALPADHIPHHPLADNIVTNYQQSNHADSPRDGTPCFRCHSDEGFRQYIGSTFQMDGAELEAALSSVIPPSTLTSVQCRTCHDPHGGEMRTPATEDSLALDDGAGGTNRVHPVMFSAQFNLCTSCHQVTLAATAVITTDAGTGEQTFEHYTYALSYDPAGTAGTPFHGFPGDPTDTTDHPERVIWDTHFADSTSGIVGYHINAAQEDACTQCHDPHAASKFEQVFASGIAEEWGNTPGFHGDYTSEAFGHGCTPCHSPEGLIELTAGGTVETTSIEPTPIACIACHDLQAIDVDDIDGDSNTTEITLGYLREFPDNEFTFPSGKIVDLGADDAENKICMTCHSGRNGGNSVDIEIASEDLNGDGLADDGAYNFQNIHYRAAGASLFGNMANGGYEFAGKSYASKFEHVSSNDLCVECHNVHSGELYLTDPGFGPLGCDNCHNVADTGNYATDVLAVRDIRMNGSLEDYDGDGDATEGIYYEVAGLKADLLAAITGSGATFTPSYPYFGNLSHAAQLQAAYNYQVVDKDPGSYAHNGDYIIQLLYDSLEAMSVAFPALGIDMNTYVREDSGHFASDGEPFRHWDEDPTMSTSCARCHSSEGAAAFFTNGTVTAADFKTYTRGISAGLACESCHVPDATAADQAFDGIPRVVTSVTFDSGVVVDSGNAPAFFAAGNDSALCMNCHQGRSSTDTVNARLAANNIAFTNIHYFAAAASLFGNLTRGGYQYTAVDSNFVVDPTYVGPNAFGSHPATLQTCEGCHLQQGGNVHSFIPDVAVCIGCHTGTSFETLGGSPSANLADINTLKAQLLGILNTAGVTYDPANYPYFDGIATAAQLKAAYNLQMAVKEPCGYIHNGDYIKQLLYDSIVDLSTDEGAPVTPSVARP